MGLMWGYRKFYVELTDTYSPEDVNTFVYDCVLPFLDAPHDLKIEKGCVYTKATEGQARALLIEWLSQFKDEQATIVTDTYYYDTLQLQKLLGPDGWPGYLDKTPLFVESEYFNVFGSHHALDDAINLHNHHIKRILLADALQDQQSTKEDSNEVTRTE